jgi:CBS domain-containing protein
LFLDYTERTMNVPLRVRDYMVTSLVTVSPDTEIMRVIGSLIEHDISGVLVVDADGTLAGIVTERDCIAVASQSGYFDEHGGPVSEFMTTPVETVGPDDSLMDVAVRMATSSHRRFPVVDKGKLIGLIGRRDVLKVLAASGWFEPR